MCIIGSLNINTNSGTVNFGGILNASPKSTSKTFKGSGGDNTGNIVNELTGPSSTNTLDANGVSQPMAGNAW